MMTTALSKVHNWLAAVGARPMLHGCGVGLLAILALGNISAKRSRDAAPTTTVRYIGANLPPTTNLRAADVTVAAGELLRPIVAAAPSGPHVRSRLMMMEVTAYCACKKCCGPGAHGVTASGKSVEYNNGRFVAADTDVLPFGTVLNIPGYNGDHEVEVVDRGGAIKGNRLDVFFASHDEALEWGRRKVAVLVSAAE